MDHRKLEKLRRRAAELRRQQPKANDLMALAKALGREKTNRGKEPTFESRAFPQLRPLSIPGHKGRDLPPGTRNSILNQLDEDFMAWEEILDAQADSKGRNGKH